MTQTKYTLIADVEDITSQVIEHYDSYADALVGQEAHERHAGDSLLSFDNFRIIPSDQVYVLVVMEHGCLHPHGEYFSIEDAQARWRELEQLATYAGENRGCIGTPLCILTYPEWFVLEKTVHDAQKRRPSYEIPEGINPDDIPF